MSKSVSASVKNLLIMPRAGMIVMLAAAAALAFAFTMQFGFNVQPCVLCLWQRLPYAVALLLGFTAVLSRPYGRHTQILLGLCAIAFLTGCGLAVFHTGVERQWWLGTTGCTIHPLHGPAHESLRDQLLHTVTARCDEISWSIFGLSMANLNVGYSLVAALFAFAASRSYKLKYRYKP